MSPLALDIPFAAVIGLCLGSFLNVVAYRLPAGLSLVTPGSACPGCGAAIRPYDNVPVVSWLVLGGHCRACDTRISARYPLIEGLTGALFAAVVIAQGSSRTIWLHLLFVAALVAITVIDLEHQIIPNRIVAPLALAAVVLTAIFEPHRLPEHLIAGAAAGGFLLAAVLAYPAGMGMGDVKLAAVMGLVLGRAVAPAMFVALISGTVVGAAVIARKGVRDGRKTRIPFGPFLALGSVVGLFAGDALVNVYLHGVGL
ncbi:MAG TPA: prepilin peptidase [Solirubrobacteraceae bacterium]|nr:prepilin peptidase [Solirubrobacteraceae bacterium]